MSDSSSGTSFRARRRLFVGGLYKGVTKDDLRMKFKPFGDVSNIQIIERFCADCHYKTFAYLDVLMSEKNFQKCLSTFNECSWRGETMRVAMAKEHYLDRLRREKEGFQNQDLVTPTITMTSTVEDMKSAIPGTQIKNKPNWIIGKYGRALPVMFLRRKDGKKLGKFDPSKNLSLLKKISENEQSKLVDELTWNLLDGTAFYNLEILAKKRPHPYPEDEKNHSKCLQLNSDVYIDRKSAIKCEESTDHVDINFVKAHHGQKIVGSKALSWLGMEISGNDEENNSEENNLEDIFQKKHFEGRSGEKLMAMQQRFGHDMRFKMDERFLDSDDESKSENDIRMGDDIDEELKQEKQLSWKVLHEVLGQNFMTIEDEKDIRNVYRDSIDVHYDPSRQNHSKFEEEVKKKKNRDEATPETEDVGLNEENRVFFSNEGKLPIKPEEKFYTVSDSLKGLFGNNDKDAELFSFFSESKQLKDCENKEGMKIDEWKGPVNLSLPYDSSESESDDDSACSSKSFTVKTKTFLFYNPKNRKMLESLQAESSSFVRKESVESLTQYWVKTRKELTQDYKKKRKDALRKRKRFTRKT